MNKEELLHQLQIFSKSTARLANAIENFDQSEIHRDGIIQRFEFCIELSWKTLQKILKYEGENTQFYPKEIFKIFYKKEIVNNIKIWFDFIDIRNRLSHEYKEEYALEAFTFIENNYKNIINLATTLQAKYDVV